MVLKIEKKYLIFPVNTLCSKKRMSFKLNGETVYKINIKLDNFNPDFYAYIDVSRFIGQTIDILVDPEMKFEIREANEIDIENLYHEPMRPQVHFTTKNGWINDPNGLIYIDGIYHMFYQYNPTEPNWDNMHWGHAVSRDLMHWTEKDIALFPDDRGDMYSGCAVYDEKNLLGVSSDGRNASLLFYTTTQPFCQHVSYSDDGFKTIKRYRVEPVVPNILGQNRDPKVIFCDELDCYVMALYLEKGEYCILKSDNLVDWIELQRIQFNGERECPDIFPINCGNGERKWIIMGAHDRYLVGNFQNGKFLPEQAELSLHYGLSGYAGQSFSNLPQGRIVRIVWDRWKLPASGFRGQMGIPVELKLCKYENVYYLEAAPVKEIEDIYTHTKNLENVLITIENGFFETLDDAAQLVKIKSSYIANGAMNISIFGREINFDFSKNEIKLGDATAPISITRGCLDITLIVDRCSIELFTDNGKIYVSCLDGYTLMDRNLPYIKINASTNISLDSIEINTLKSIWG